MHLSQHARDRAIVSVLFGGAAVLLVVALVLWRGSSGDHAPGSQEPPSGAQALLQQDTGPVAIDEPGKHASTVRTEPDALTNGAPDPFGTSTGDDSPHKVEIRISSDGAFYAGWRYRTKGGDGLKVGDRSLVVGKTVRGGLPVAEVAVQALQTSTYATCTIYVDGVAVTTQTAKGVNHVTICIG